MINVFNTLTRKKEELIPLVEKKINLFVCGPTVYDFSHIGHARTYIAFDVIVKYLRQRGFSVFYLQNITDIDDKIIDRAAQKNKEPLALSREFEKEYFKDIKALKVDSVTKYARATEHIKEIISQVKRLIEKGYGYELEDGIYYDLAKFKDYGKLSGRTVLQAEDSVSRIDESKNKRNAGDFCLWKYSKPDEPKWPSPWKPGRPGWHIEDTAITEKYFGPQYDIHGGARDLIFPHHEAEIAQIEAISGLEPMVKYWVHTGFLTVEKQKMSKSLGNFITIRDFLKEYSPEVLRIFVTSSHYRSPIDYSDKAISQAKSNLERINEFVEKLESRKLNVEGGEKQAKDLVLKSRGDFEKAMGDDFNTPQALAVIFSLVSEGNRLLAENKLSQNNAEGILNFLKEVDEVFGFISWKTKKEEVPQNILKLVKEREKYRKDGGFEKADEIRKEIEKLGYVIEDTEEGPKIKKI